MKRWIYILIISLLGLNACSAFPVLKPIYPEAMTTPVTLDSLSPTLKWKPFSEPNVTYDVVIYDVITAKSPAERKAMGKVVYYREGLKEPQHKIETPLRPSTEYYWSVRVRRGEKVSDWSTYSYFVYLGVGYSSGDNLPFMFKTPDSK